MSPTTSNNCKMTAMEVVRTFLYSFCIGTSISVLAIAAAFIHEVSQRLYGYYEVSVELLVAAALLLLVFPVLHFFIHFRRIQPGVLSSLGFEVAVIFVLWALYLGGAAAITSDLGPAFRSRACGQSRICGLGRALQVLSWITWAALTLLLGFVLVIGLRSGSWGRPLNETVRGAGGVDRQHAYQESSTMSNVPRGATVTTGTNQV